MEGSNLPLPAAPCALPTIVGDTETPFAQQRVWLTKQEHIQLKSDVAFWKAQHGRAVARERALEKELEKARGEIRDLRQRLYGRKSEKAAPRDDRTFTGGGSSRPRGQQKGAKGHGRTARPQLPVEEEVQDLPGGAPCCATCHQPYLPFFRTEDSDVIEVQVRAHVRRIKRKMYQRGCQCEASPGLLTAPLPLRLLPRNPLGISVWAEVLLDKYLYARPTHRLLQHYASLGLPISQGTVTDGLKRLAPLFEPLIEAMHAQQMRESLFFGDETRWMVFETVEGKIGRRWYLWVTVTAPTSVWPKRCRRCYWPFVGPTCDGILSKRRVASRNTRHGCSSGWRQFGRCTGSTSNAWTNGILRSRWNNNPPRSPATTRP